mmetsp:Transcript_24676/g.38316  ORF Transcript_24676/g.38316 Transcript_24676/m.38316 type:complete len:271 (+) Transcript_24676:99-911(+)
MKFIKIATISFLAGNAAVAAAHSHIPAKKCKKAAKDLHMCVLKVIADDTTGAKASAWENVITEAEGCYTAAGDDKAAQEACAMPVLELSAEDCPSGFDALLKACAPTSFEFEDFVLDLAEELEFERFAEEIAEEISEELEGAAFWEGEEEEDFIAKKVSKKCENQGAKIHQCIKDTIAKDTKDTRKWGRSLEKAAKKAESCAKKAVDEDAKLECASSALDIIDEHCSLKALRKACKIPAFMFEDFALDLAEELESTAYAYGLRGSTVEEE